MAHDAEPVHDRYLTWTEEENRLLREMVTQYGFRWKFLTDSYFPNRAPAHWATVGNPRQELGTWLPEEENRLLDAVQMGKLSWPAIAERVGTRNQRQCWFKYYNLTHSKQKGIQVSSNISLLDAFSNVIPICRYLPRQVALLVMLTRLSWMYSSAIQVIGSPLLLKLRK
ncbi:hypothetical protein BC936DRAFT_143175 [Jimgerdemannia flammicorona]|uniref:Homeodomain-like protein n=1 Tax=Jimgerdemannia flammicorona TaxID=994334 RepID=A0A432ZZC0_9FUNG|nr:hypothetical protein BC936DRAFT_143175 [Jimgerdemannia flammicorona]